MSATRLKRPSLVSKPKPAASTSPNTDIAASLPRFKPPTGPSQPTTTTNTTTTPTPTTITHPTSHALADEATKMQHRLHALRSTMAEDKRQRDARLQQRKAASASGGVAGGVVQEQPLSQREYLRQLQARLEAKKVATREKVRQVKAEMDRAGEYVAPLGHGQRLALFERVSEEWLKDDDSGEPQLEVGDRDDEYAAREQSVAGASAVVEESKEMVSGGTSEDGAVVIVAADDADLESEAEGHAEFVKAREEWLRSLQQPASAAPTAASRPTTASSSTTTSAATPTLTMRPVPSAPSSTAAAVSPLLVGEQFDERASAASFQDAREAWLRSLATQPPRTTTTPTTALSPTLHPQHPPPTAAAMVRHSCYQCYRLFVVGAGAVGGEAGRELCGAECAGALERVEGLRRERARSMRAMEQRIRALQQEQQLATVQQQQAADEAGDVEDEKEGSIEPVSGSVLASVPLLSLPVVAAERVDGSVLDLPVSARRFTATDEQPEPVIEFPSA